MEPPPMEPPSDRYESSSAAMSGSMTGVIAALGVSVCSGFASVYLEKILKGDKTSLCTHAHPNPEPDPASPSAWSHPAGRADTHARVCPCVCDRAGVRNVQLCMFSIPLQFMAVYQRDWDRVQDKGWLHGFCPGTWAVVSMFAFGGLLVAVVIRFADNNLKNLAMALAILVSCLASVPLFGFVPNGMFGLGGLLVVLSIFMYAWQPKAASSNYIPVSGDESAPTPARPSGGGQA